MVIAVTAPSLRRYVLARLPAALEWRAGPMVHLPAGLAEAFRRLSSRTRRALLLAAVAAVIVGAAALWFLPSATLTVLCRHDFRRGEITVAVDDDVVLTDTLAGSTSRRFFGVVEKTGGTYTRSVAVPAGKATVEVRLRASGYDRTRRIQADFERGEEAVLSVDTGREALAWRVAGPDAAAVATAASTAEAAPGWFKYASSILFTILGSIVSASIGVFLQDYLRTRKARKTESAAATQPRSP